LLLTGAPLDGQGEFEMRACDITGKKVHLANNVSHAQNRTRKRQLPNLQDKRVWVPEQNRFVKLTLSTRAIRTINKIGLKAVCKKFNVNFESITKPR
jgi:large subunit ribosomal protein L28